MSYRKKVKNEEVEIDLLKLVSVLWKRLWLIILVAVITGGATLYYSMNFITPQYESSAEMYVNSKNLEFGGSSISLSSGEISASRSLVSTYSVIIRSRTTLEAVINELDLIGSDGEPMKYEELLKKVTASAVDNTEVIKITVKDVDPNRSMRIANTIVDILPRRISSIVDGTKPNTVDPAVVGKKVSPSLAKNTVLGAFVGAVLVAAVIVVQTFLDNVIHDEKDLLEKYDLPLLAVVPDLRAGASGKYKKRGGYYSKSYGDAYRRNAETLKNRQQGGDDAVPASATKEGNNENEQ